MNESLRHLLNNVVDYAGLFPPAKLSFKKAAEEYLEHKASAAGSMLSHFICPVARFDELREHFRKAPAITVSALGAGGPDPDSWNRQTAKDLTACARLEKDSGGALTVKAFETPLPHSIRLSPDHSPVRDWLMEMHRMVAESGTSIQHVFLETPPGTKDGEKIHWLFHTLEMAELEHDPMLGVKLRTGGLEPEAFPTPKQVAAFISAAWKNDLIFKCTAGLHHPFRHMNTDMGCEMHGFINVFAGAALLAAGTVNQEQLEELLADRNSKSFTFDDFGLAWQGHACGLDTIKAARSAFAVSFGSCSFQEPLDDLSFHNLL